MEYKFPLTIENGHGEKLTFLAWEKNLDGDKLIVENFVAPKAGPPMHTHYFQEEALTVVSGKIGYVVKGQQPRYAEAGETVVFAAGVPHRFWNAGNNTLHCKGYITPANTIVFFLSSIFAAQKKSGSGKPELFDGAFLVKRYASEFDLELPWLVKKIMIPLTYYTGKALGRYKHFENAPAPVKSATS